MGAASWMSGGVRRAMTGVRSSMPGQPVSGALGEAGLDPVARAAVAEDPASSAGAQPAASTPTPSWSDDELADFRAALVGDISRLREELNMGEADLAEMLVGDGAGDDQADAGSTTLEREQEMSVAANAQELLDQSTHAMRRLEAGTYGSCESCSSKIPAARLRAFPRATLCIACKQAEERS